MRKLLVVLLVVGIFGVWLKDYARGGRLDRYLDRHFTPEVKAPLEYYAGILLSLADRKQSAAARFTRVMEKYPKTEYAPLAWVERIEVLDDMNARDLVVEECRKFMNDYPDHPKARLIRKKLDFIEHGY